VTDSNIQIGSATERLRVSGGAVACTDDLPPWMLRF
jgi:hypothetical protein